MLEELNAAHYFDRLGFICGPAAQGDRGKGATDGWNDLAAEAVKGGAARGIAPSPQLSELFIPRSGWATRDHPFASRQQRRYAMCVMPPLLPALPGADLVAAGLRDLRQGVDSIPALLVAIGAPRLRRAGIAVPDVTPATPERRLYDRLAAEDSDSAHSRYNAFLRRLVSCERALECASHWTASDS